MTADDQRHYTSIVEKRIPEAWRNDIKVDAVGDASEPGRHVYVRISTRSKLGRAQAMMSIGPYVSNSPAEWSGGWQREANRFLFVAFDPSVSPVQQTIAEIAEANPR